MLEQIDTRRGNLSFYLGDKALSNLERQALNIDVVKVIIRYIIATGQLNIEIELLINN